MQTKFSFKSYCWNFGTTSFRMNSFNQNIEKQLSYLSSFWNNPDNIHLDWTKDTQQKYYKFLYKNGFVKGNILNDPDKQAKTGRQKTSPLEELGLVRENRRLTLVGEKLLKIAEMKDFTPDNEFGIPKDSFIYFKQLLKVAIHVNSEYVRPYLVIGQLIYFCNSYLTEDEFTYLAPLCINQETTQLIIKDIEKLRAHEIDIDTILSEVIIMNDLYNYKKALNFFVTKPATSENIQIIGMNRDGIKHDKVYVPLFNALKSFYLDGQKNDECINAIAQAINGLSGKLKGFWHKTLFNKKKKFNKRRRYPYSAEDLKLNKFNNINTIYDFKETFFFYLHVFKIRATLSDYYDLNRRYLKLTDSILFENERVEFTELFNSFFHTEARHFFDNAFSKSSNLLERDCSLTDINHFLTFSLESVIRNFKELYHIKTEIHDISDLKHHLKSRNRKLFIDFIDKKFPNHEIVRLLSLFEERSKRSNKHDNELMRKVDYEADVPTIFEYVVGIIWFRLSDYKGDIFDYMKLSLGADMLPRQHAAGGNSDIVYQYSASQFYDKHTLLIECTLMQGINQRNCEMEPVTRHLLNYMLDYDRNSYCVFIANKLVPAILSDFRMRAFSPMYRDTNSSVESMKIIPLDIKDLKNIVNSQIKYPTLYQIFDAAYHDTEYRDDPISWRCKCITDKL